jgi:hypothetical protein
VHQIALQLAAVVNAVNSLAQDGPGV